MPAINRYFIAPAPPANKLVGRSIPGNQWTRAMKQTLDNTQNLNRYSFCLNNPLKYSDPSGESFALPFMLMTTAAEFLSNLIQGNSNALGKAFGKANVITNGMSNCAKIKSGSTSIGLDPFILGVSITRTSNSGISSTVGFGFFGVYANVSGSVTLDDFNFNVGAGYSSGYGNLIDQSTKVSGWNYYGGVTYYDRANDQFFSFGGTISSGSHPQNNLFIGYKKFDFSFRMTNDVYTGSDMWRTAAAEVGIWDYSFGFNLFTTPPPEEERDPKHFQGGDKEWKSPIWRENGGEKYTYSGGSRVCAGVYFGLKTRNNYSRVGVDAPWVQDFFQNGLHKLIGSLYFNTSYGPPTRFFLQGGHFNPNSLYPFYYEIA